MTVEERGTAESNAIYGRVAAAYSPLWQTGDFPSCLVRRGWPFPMAQMEKGILLVLIEQHMYRL
jgi:hypothetical protein